MGGWGGAFEREKEMKVEEIIVMIRKRKDS